MPHTYSSQYPTGVQIDGGIKAFFEEFYRTTDRPDALEEYADAFTDDATFILASNKGVGREAILQIRKGMWTAVSARLHYPIKIFPFGSGSKEVMIYGTLDYTLKDGRKVEVEWAAKVELVQEAGKWKMEFYQVYTDTAAIKNAK